MIDIHSHILPSVDDGSSCVEESLEMLRIASKEGIRKIFLTPHYILDSKPFNREHNLRLFDDLKQLVLEEGIDIEIYLGNEIFVSLEMVRLLKSKEVCSLANSRYVLIEFARHSIPIHIDEILYELRIAGYIPVIAHPERYREVVEDPNILVSLIEKGALCQMNIGSITGRYGDEIKDCATILLSHNMIHFLGTDSHSSTKFRPVISSGMEEIKKILSSNEIEFLAIKNPQAIIEDRVIDPVEPKTYKPSRFKRIIEIFKGF